MFILSLYLIRKGNKKHHILRKSVRIYKRMTPSLSEMETVERLSENITKFKEQNISTRNALSSPNSPV